MANKSSVSIEMDNSAMRNIQKNLDSLKTGGAESAYRALMKVAFKIKAEAQLRLTGRGHIVTSRLKNSIFVKSKKMTDVIKRGNSLTYTDTKGNSYKSDMTTFTLNDFEFAIGSNVEYAQDIEFGSRAHEIMAKSGGVLSWMPKAIGKAWFAGKNKSTLKSYYKDKAGANTLTNQRVFAKSVRHPGFKGDSFLYWAMKNANVMQSVAKDMTDDIKFGRFMKKPTIYDTKGKATTDFYQNMTYAK